MSLRFRHQLPVVFLVCVFLASAVNGGPPSRSDPWGKIGYWAMDEGKGDVVKDSSGDEYGNKHNGSRVGATWITGYRGYALRFLDTHIVTNIAAAFDDTVTSGSITIAAWLRWEGPHPKTRSPYSYVFDARDLNNRRGFILYVLPSGKMMFQVLRENGTYQAINSGFWLLPNQWTHVTAVLDFATYPRPKELRFYKNEQLWSTAPADAAYRDTKITAAIGNNRWAPGNGQWAGFNGRIDEVKIWKRALSQSEVYQVSVAPADCNNNETDDAADITTGTSHDWDANGVPDECQPNCNENELPDFCDVPGGCDVGGCGDDPNCGASTDCQLNGIPDECEDCNENDIRDCCDISCDNPGCSGVLDCGLIPDCNGNGVPDDCEWDCNGNGVPDDCDIVLGTSLDEDLDGVPDECELFGDVNCDWQIDGRDIGPFVLAIIDQTANPDCYLARADMDGNGTVDGLDIQLFVDLLLGVLPPLPS